MVKVNANGHDTQTPSVLDQLTPSERIFEVQSTQKHHLYAEFNGWINGGKTDINLLNSAISDRWMTVTTSKMKTTTPQLP